MSVENDNEVQYNLDGTPIDPSVTPQEEEPEVTPQEVQALTTSVEMLNDLYYTASKRGVSKADILAFKDICIKMNLPVVETTLVPAIEQYPLGFYTDDRTSVNLNYALESFGSAIVSAIKAVFQKLIEMIRALVRDARKVFNGDVVKRKLENQTNALYKGRMALKENIRLYGMPADLNQRMGELAIDTLIKKFTVNDVLMSFFGSVTKSDIKLLTIASKPTVQALVSVANALSAIIDGKVAGGEIIVDLPNLKRLEHAAKMAKDLSTPPTLHGENWIRQFVLDNSIRTTDNIFNHVDIEALATFTPVEEYIDGFHLISTVLEKANKKIQQYHPDEQKATDEVRQINEYAAMLSQHVGNVKTIMQFIIDYNQLKLRLIAAVYNNDAVMASEIFRYARAKVVDDAIEKALTKAHDTLVDIYKVITN